MLNLLTSEKRRLVQSQANSDRDNIKSLLKLKINMHWPGNQCF